MISSVKAAINCVRYSTRGSESFTGDCASLIGCSCEDGSGGVEDWRRVVRVALGSPQIANHEVTCSVLDDLHIHRMLVHTSKKCQGC